MRILQVGLALLLLGCAEVKTPQYYDAEAMENFNKAEKYYEARNFDKAIKLYKEVIKVRNYWILPFKRLGLCYEMLGENKSAIDTYKGALSIDSKDVDVLTRLANIAEKEGLKELELDVKERLLVLTPDDEKLHSDCKRLREFLKKGR